jgi:cytoskeletal protein CcmA (bactofilin family)
MAIFSRPSQSTRPDLSARRGDGAGLTIIASGTTVAGDVISDGIVKIEGAVEGTIRAGTQLLIAPGAQVRGDVFALEVIVGGEIRGGVHADERVEIQTGAIVDGDIRTQRLHIVDGGRVNGHIVMESEGSARGTEVFGSQGLTNA